MYHVFFVPKQISIKGLSAEEKRGSHRNATCPRTREPFPVRESQINQIAWLGALHLMSPIPFKKINILDRTYGAERNKRARLHVGLPNEDGRIRQHT